ncbi:MAG: TetR/AcrR family transcriptional regulator [Actinomycetota bacterium]|nr:TetR/AcrR family transcriptional regulator [Actinomycetota bacterium]
MVRIVDPVISEIFAPRHYDGGLPPVPDPATWPILDAAARVIRRYGWARTSVKDVAREAGVERTTVYRRVGSMEDIFRLLVALELHRLIEDLPSALPDTVDGAEIVVSLLASAIERSLAHPVVAKVLSDEPELVGVFLVNGVPDLVTRAATTLRPLMVAAMDAGAIARRDPLVVGEWIVRTGLSLLIAPPPGDLRAFLREVLVPVLSPR